MNKIQKIEPGIKLRGEDKLLRNRIKIPVTQVHNKKPNWIRTRLPSSNQIGNIKALLREKRLHTVCEEASCPNLPECFGNGTATFMIMGDICTRRCPFCDVAHGRPKPLDIAEPKNVAHSVKTLRLKYVVITSVDRDDLRDGGAQHFVDCIQAVRAENPHTTIEVLVPDFRARMDIALRIMSECVPDVFNHNIESAPQLYAKIRPGSDYQHSLTLLKRFKQACPGIPTKSGLMVGLGETDEQVEQVLSDLRQHEVDMLTIGQYLQPSKHHAPVERWVTPERFEEYARIAKSMGFSSVASGPMVRSSYHADQQYKETT